jgi:uncharacterized repeat protein (TIGR02543 family)
MPDIKELAIISPRHIKCRTRIGSLQHSCGCGTLDSSLLKEKRMRKVGADFVLTRGGKETLKASELRRLSLFPFLVTGKFLFPFMLVGVALFLCLGASGSPVAHVHEAWALDPSPYYTVTPLALPDGTIIEEVIINGPPVPPPGFELERQAVSLLEFGSVAGVNILTEVPAFNWVFGCSAVSGAMIAGYYDRSGWSNIYTGPTNSGVMPLNNGSWPIWSDGHTTYPSCPLIASKNGVDGRATHGSIDDYWVQYNSGTADPYITNAWTQHAWGDAIGDYMKTSQSAFGNTDGSTSFYNWNNSASPLTCTDMVTYGIDIYDGTYGRKLFYEARGYTVTDCYNQKTDNTIANGFSFANFKAEIDAGRPVMLNLAGHTIVGVGYDDSSNLVYIHDTWDYSNHTMTWGGSYSGMALQTVSIVNLQTPSGSAPTVTTSAATSVTSTTATVNGTVNPNGSSTTAYFQYGTTISYGSTTASQSMGSGTSAVAASANLTGLATGVTYHFRIVATNSAGTSYGSDMTFTPSSTSTAPTVTTSAATSVTSTTATLNGTVNPNGSSTTAYFQYGTTISYGRTAPSKGSIVMGSGTSAVAASANLTGLATGVTYHFRIVATNSAGTSYGSDMTFTASSTPPSNYTLVVTSYPIKSGSVTLSPPGGSYSAGTQVTLTAKPVLSRVFTGWSGDATRTITGTTNPITLTMPSSNVTVTANFK